MSLVYNLINDIVVILSNVIFGGIIVSISSIPLLIYLKINEEDGSGLGLFGYIILRILRKIM